MRNSDLVETLIVSVRDLVQEHNFYKLRFGTKLNGGEGYGPAGEYRVCLVCSPRRDQDHEIGCPMPSIVEVLSKLDAEALVNQVQIAEDWDAQP